MYILNLAKHLSVPSAWKFRSAVRNPDGAVIRIKPKRHSAVYIRRSKADLETIEEIFFGPGVYEAALGHLDQCQVFVDLGANIGLCSVLVHESFPAARVLAFEPHPGNHSLLTRNAPFAEAFQAAAWSQDGTVNLEGGVEFFNGFKAREGGDIPAYSMSTILAKAGGSIDFLKMDIEGGEVELFKDPSWLRNVRLLAIEFHGDSRRECDFDTAIREHGLTVVSETKHTTVAIRK